MKATKVIIKLNDVVVGMINHLDLYEERFSKIGICNRVIFNAELIDYDWKNKCMQIDIVNAESGELELKLINVWWVYAGVAYISGNALCLQDDTKNGVVFQYERREHGINQPRKIQAQSGISTQEIN